MRLALDSSPVIDLSFVRPTAAEEQQVAEALEAVGFRLVPALMPWKPGEEALPGLPWETVVLQRSGGAGGISPEDMRYVFTVFFGGYLTGLGTLAATDTYQALRRAFGAVVGRILRRVTLRFVAVDEQGGVDAMYDLPEDPAACDRALAHLRVHRESLQRDSPELWFAWDDTTAKWVPHRDDD
jgi:hypothetical protein